VIVGRGGFRYPQPFEQLGGVRIVEAPMPLAAAAAALAAERAALAGPPHALRPVYLRRPDAVLARERQAP
jgi:tRNA A37 threonylcarbamoyladenosine modification protein TsaB